MSTAKIQGTEEAWDEKQLGADADHTKAASKELTQQVDDSLGLQMISIRLDKALIESFRLIGEFHGVGYQPLMRDALKRFAEHEFRNIVQGVVESQRKRAESPSVSTKAKAKDSSRASKSKTDANLQKEAA